MQNLPPTTSTFKTTMVVLYVCGSVEVMKFYSCLRLIESDVKASCHTCLRSSGLSNRYRGSNTILCSSFSQVENADTCSRHTGWLTLTQNKRMSITHFITHCSICKIIMAHFWVNYWINLYLLYSLSLKFHYCPRITEFLTPLSRSMSLKWPIRSSSGNDPFFPSSHSSGWSSL